MAPEYFTSKESNIQRNQMLWQKVSKESDFIELERKKKNQLFRKIKKSKSTFPPWLSSYNSFNTQQEVILMDRNNKESSSQELFSANSR